MGMGAVLAVVLGTDLPLVVVGQRMLVILDSFPFLALPFFVIAGLFMEKGGITRRLIDFAALFVARITGGLAHVIIGANLAMSGASGSATADCAATGSVLIPALGRARLFAGLRRGPHRRSLHARRHHSSERAVRHLRCDDRHVHRDGCFSGAWCRD